MADVLIPQVMEAATGALQIAPGRVAGGHGFLTGMTGSRPDGTMPADPGEQFRAAFDKIGLVLAEAGLSFADIVEMTSYHIGLRAHFDLFLSVRAEYVVPPFPAWTAVGVAELRREGALVEIRVIAALPSCVIATL